MRWNLPRPSLKDVLMILMLLASIAALVSIAVGDRDDHHYHDDGYRTEGD